MIIKTFSIKSIVLILLAIIVTVLLINIAFVAKERAQFNARYDVVYISQFGLNIGIDVPVYVPKGRLPVGDGYGQMSFNVQSAPTGYSFQNTFPFPLVPEAYAQGSDGGGGSGESVTVDVGGGGGSFTTSSSGEGGDSSGGGLDSSLDSLTGAGAILEPFGGVAYGFPCCNGWFYYMEQCGKCEDANVGESQTHFAWWFSLRKHYLPTGGNPVLGLYIDEEEDCELLLPPYCYCDCDIEAEVTDYIVGTANNSSKSSQTTSSGSGSGSTSGGGGF